MKKLKTNAITSIQATFKNYTFCVIPFFTVQHRRNFTIHSGNVYGRPKQKQQQVLVERFIIPTTALGCHPDWPVTRAAEGRSYSRAECWNVEQKKTYNFIRFRWIEINRIVVSWSSVIKPEISSGSNLFWTLDEVQWISDFRQIRRLESIWLEESLKKIFLPLIKIFSVTAQIEFKFK